MSWYTPPGSYRSHSLTGATNMRDHRRLKRDQAEERQAEEQARANAWRLPEAPRGGTSEAPPKRKRKRKKSKKNNGSLSLAALEVATGEWLETNGPGRDF